MKNTLITFLAFIFTILTAPLFAEDRLTETQTRVDKIQQEMRSNLREGRTEQARNNLEQAAGNFHAVEIELGLIQTLMQAGEYRHALSAAAHTQAEHPDTIDSTLFYAWLLAIGGQINPATQLLEATIESHLNDDALTLMLQQFKKHLLVSNELKTSDAIQLQPFIAKDSKINSLEYLTTGIAVNNGKAVIAQLPDVMKLKAIRIINGLGRETTAHIEKQIPNSNFVLLSLDNPFKTGTITIAEKLPFPGRPIYIIGFSIPNCDLPDWPQLKTDILGIPSTESNTKEIHTNYPIHARNLTMGSGVYNQDGELIGITGGENNSVMVSISNLLTTYKTPTQIVDPPGKLAMDEIYETALSNTVKVFGRRE